MKTTQSPATHTPTPWTLRRVIARSVDSTGVLNICSESGPILAITDRNAEDEANAAFIVKAVNSHAQLVAALDTLEADAVNLHCALQSTAHMDPRDTRIAAITGQVVEDLLAMRDKARAALESAKE